LNTDTECDEQRSRGRRNQLRLAGRKIHNGPGRIACTRPGRGTRGKGNDQERGGRKSRKQLEGEHRRKMSEQGLDNERM
jgi:hypothetical protein